MIAIKSIMTVINIFFIITLLAFGQTDVNGRKCNVMNISMILVFAIESLLIWN